MKVMNLVHHKKMFVFFHSKRDLNHHLYVLKPYTFLYLIL